MMDNTSVQDTQAKPTYKGRPRLSLPGVVDRFSGNTAATGFKPAPRGDYQPARLPLPLAPVNRSGKGLQAAVPSTSDPHNIRQLSKPWHARMTAELAGILGIAEEDLPPILRGRMPMPLKIGIHGDLLARYPNADTEATRRWLGQRVRTEQYLAQLAAGGNRYGLDGAPSGEVTEKASKAARDQLERLNSKKPSGIAV